ncbi:hypothetical protein ACFVVU_26770 [Kitasatospora sp. NPDC057965]|uniref:hypothetical protein n=1 Tax=Kitasatospora sp. NPDC057965 TaxID=3346291 RepID=UPI0036DEFA77
MKMNSLMASLWQSDAEAADPGLPEDLQALVTSGWRTGPAGALVLAGCYEDGGGWRQDWEAGIVPQHELEVNDVYIPCDDFPEDREIFLRCSVARSRKFADAALRAAHPLINSGLLVAVISVGISEDYLMHGATVKFATRRSGFPEYYGDLERFCDEAMALVEFRDFVK